MNKQTAGVLHGKYCAPALLALPGGPLLGQEKKQGLPIDSWGLTVAGAKVSLLSKVPLWQRCVDCFHCPKGQGINTF